MRKIWIFVIVGLLIAILPYVLAFIGWSLPTTNRSRGRDTFDAWCGGKYQLFREMTPSGEPQEFELADMDTLESVSRHIISYMKDKKMVVFFSKDSSRITLLNLDDEQILQYSLDEKD